MVRIKMALPQRWTGKSKAKKKTFLRPSWTKLFSKGESSSSSPTSSKTAGKSAALSLLSDDDRLHLPILESTEVLLLEYTPLNTQREDSSQNPNTGERHCAEEIMEEILEEDPIVACSEVPFQDSLPGSDEDNTERKNVSGPIRWSLRKAKATEVTEGPTNEQLEAKESETKKKKMKKRKAREEHSSPKLIILQRNLDVLDFSKKTNLLPILHSNKLFKSVTLPGSFVKQVIQEFYSNLSESCVDVDDPSYHKVFVRGRLYDFSPCVINNFLGTTSNPAITPIAEETVWNDLTNGLRDYLHGKTKVPSSVLKSSYALLLRIAAFHWLPTTHTNTVPLCMATLLYKIKNHAPLDLGRTVFDQVDSRHLEESHFNDMVDTEASGGTAQDPFSVEIQLSFLDKEIKALQMDVDYHQEIAQRSTERRNMLIHIAHTLRQTRGAQRQGESLTKHRAAAARLDSEKESLGDSEEESF
ncbi:unnamed protein product [Cuscuta campestris]|uniref:Putative plant transposon protein domain-containing protein n=1 Tax=Cuscuta campestris TaxID=132261 RepID=A0A484LJ20_9ASTE|nr:unnamed protein product [Cuscuta campestris]